MTEITPPEHEVIDLMNYSKETIISHALVLKKDTSVVCFDISFQSES